MKQEEKVEKHLFTVLRNIVIESPALLARGECVRPELVVGNGTLSPLGISTPSPYRKDFY